MESDRAGGQPSGKHFGGVALAPTVCAYADPKLEDRAVIESLSAHGIDVCRNCNEFRTNGLEGAEAAIYASATLSGPAWSGLVGLRTERVALPLLIITAYTRANMRAFARLETDELLFLDDISQRTLAAAIQSLTRRTTLALAAAALRENAMGLDPELAETLARACIALRLVRTVNDLARIMGHHPSELRRRWNACTPVDSHPHHFLEWLLLMHALLLRSRTQKSWMHVADALGVKWHTLSDTCKRVFDATLGQLEHFNRDRLLAKLWEIAGGPSLDLRGRSGPEKR